MRIRHYQCEIMEASHFNLLKWESWRETHIYIVQSDGITINNSEIRRLAACVPTSTAHTSSLMIYAVDWGAAKFVLLADASPVTRISCSYLIALGFLLTPLQ